MITSLRAFFGWVEVRRDNHWSYRENRVTKERKVIRHNFTRGWPATPYDRGWEQGFRFDENYYGFPRHRGGVS